MLIVLDRFTWYQQSAYRWAGDELTAYIDPWGLAGELEPADVIFITHAHFDHYSPDDIGRIRKDGTVIVAPHDVAADLTGEVRPVAPGDAVEAAGVKAQALPAYNIVEEREQNHPRSNRWVGYLLELEGTTYYHAGDTDHLPELEDLRANIAFLPIGGSGYTMDASEAAALAKAIAPDVAVPMHYGGFVEGCGAQGDAERFTREAAPVTVEILTPENPFRA